MAAHKKFKTPIIVECEICGKIFEKGHRQNQASHNLCSNKCKYIFLGKMNEKHSFAHKEKLYCVWKSMRERCKNSRCKSYKNYGGRGIKVCDEWDNNYLSFRNWAFANGYIEYTLPNGQNELTIDRINVNGNYEPNNCRWITNAEQAKNKRHPRIKIIEKVCPICNNIFNVGSGKKRQKTCSKECGIKKRILDNLIKTQNAYKKECLECHKLFEDRSGHFKEVKYCSTKCANRTKSAKYKYKGQLLTLKELENINGINEHTIEMRLARGWNIDDAVNIPLSQIRSYRNGK